MAARTITCCVCGETVSKRKSLSYKEGRACRGHDEVKALLQLQEKAKHQEKEGNDSMQKIIAVSFVRTMYTVRGTPIEVLYTVIRKNHSQAFVDAVRKEVEKTGARLADGEVSVAAMMGSASFRKKIYGEPEAGEKIDLVATGKTS